MYVNSGYVWINPSLDPWQSMTVHDSPGHRSPNLDHARAIVDDHRLVGNDLGAQWDRKTWFTTGCGW